MFLGDFGFKIHIWKAREMFNGIILIKYLHQMKKLYTSDPWKMPKEEQK